MNTMLPASALRLAANNINDILHDAIKHQSQQKAVIIADKQSSLAVGLADAYRQCLPDAIFIDFDEVAPSDIFAVFDTLIPSDLVVLIQSSSFRLKDFRVRVELFEKSLKVIEHPHLARMSLEEAEYYIESLAYDKNYYHGVGHGLKKLIDNAQSCVVDSGGEKLVFSSALEPAKLNIGDYTGMKNIGGQFPIGEVFTESQILENVNGRVRIYAFADRTFTVNKPEKPILLVIEAGRVSEVFDSTPEFDTVLENIRHDEKVVWLRELGFGMNRAFTPNKLVKDVGTFERMCGIHISLGTKHTVYKKSNFRTRDTWHHVDVFAVTEGVYLDDKQIFQQGQWLL